MSYIIERNTVQETLIIPLYARKMCSELSSACTGMRRRGGL